jgi:NAD(P)-dependent dehydrogenase (short-subunit alcohol dehydrogenase family)
MAWSSTAWAIARTAESCPRYSAFLQVQFRQSRSAQHPVEAIESGRQREPADCRLPGNEQHRAMSQSRTIVLTGVSRGLGRAMLAEFAAGGHVVAGCARNRATLAALSREFSAPHDFAAVDVRDDAAVGDWARHVLETIGPPDLLLNNAAIIHRNAPLWHLSPAEFGEVIDVNLKGVFHVLRHFVPAMIERGRGVIVNFSSGWGRSTSPEVAPYCATKWAIEGLTQALAEELPAGMAAVPLNPGVIDTDMLRSCFGDDAETYPRPETWAKRAVPFLLSLDPRHNGQPLTVG